MSPLYVPLSCWCMSCLPPPSYIGLTHPCQSEDWECALRTRPPHARSFAGVLVRQFDTLDDPNMPWLPCPKDAWCATLADRWSASIINSRARHLFYGENKGGIYPESCMPLGHAARSGIRTSIPTARRFLLPSRQHLTFLLPHKQPVFSWDRCLTCSIRFFRALSRAPYLPFAQLLTSCMLLCLKPHMPITLCCRA